MTQTSETHTLLSARDAAVRLGVSPHRVYELIADGVLPHVRLGRSVRLDPGTLEAFIRNGGTLSPAGLAPGSRGGDQPIQTETGDNA